MNVDRSLIEHLSHFGITVGQQGKHSLQQKIIQMYDLLEQKTTQNLLLRKENDDIKLQIDTINELFSNTPLYCATQNNANQYSGKYQNQSLGIENSKRIAYFVTGKQNGSYALQNRKCQNFRNQQSAETDSKYDFSQASYENERKNPSFQHKSIPRSSKPSQNSRFCRQQKQNTQVSQEKTSRKESNLIEKKQQKSLNQKIEFLMSQNQTILKRMNQIEVNFIKGSREEQDSQMQNKKCFDDRQTYISSNVTSIHNIRNRKETYIEERGLKSHGRKHFSTNNLRAYCPSVDR